MPVAILGSQTSPRLGGGEVIEDGHWELGGAGFEPDGAEVVSGGAADVCVEGGGDADGDGGLGAAWSLSACHDREQRHDRT